MKKYVLLMRLDHWIKQLFVLPGLLVAMIFIDKEVVLSTVVLKTLIALASISLVASSNYVINEWLDAEFDKYHPIKKNRSAVKEKLNQKIVYVLYIFLFAIGSLLGLSISRYFFYTTLCLWLTGILYNVKPFRIKDIAYIDALFESINNPIRFLAGWLIMIDTHLPPLPIVLSYWFIGAFLMTAKRFAEYRMFSDKEIAYKYRKSFEKYSEKKLLIAAILYSVLSILLLLFFSLKYKIELIALIPLYICLICYYFKISLKESSIVQRPEAIYKDKILVFYIVLIAIILIVLMKKDIL